jgi:hypothetical protein
MHTLIFVKGARQKVMDCRVAALLSMNRFRHCGLDPQSSVCVALDAGSRPAGQLSCAV